MAHYAQPPPIVVNSQPAQNAHPAGALYPPPQQAQQQQQQYFYPPQQQPPQQPQYQYAPAAAAAPPPLYAPTTQAMRGKGERGRTKLLT